MNFEKIGHQNFFPNFHGQAEVKKTVHSPCAKIS